MTGSETNPEVGQDVLVLDLDESVRKGANRMLREVGFSVTALSDMDRAKDQITNRFFPVVLADLDTPTEDAALGLIAFARERSPLTSVIVMTKRVSYDVLSKVFRAGAKDVVPKSREHARHLRESVLAAAAHVQSTRLRERLLIDLVDMNEELLRKLMDLSRQIVDHEDASLARDGEISSAVAEISTFRVLFADENESLASVLQNELPADKGWEITHVHSGGEALDQATQRHPHLLIAKEALPDLPGSMVVKTVKSTLAHVVAMLFTGSPGSHAGEIQIAEDSKLHVLVPQFKAPADLIEQMEKVREKVMKKAKEKRYLKIFQTRHLEILQKCQRLKQRADAPEEIIP